MKINKIAILRGYIITGFVIASIFGSAKLAFAQSLIRGDDAKTIRLVVLHRNNGYGNVASADGKINCGGSATICSANYVLGESVTLKATALDGSKFEGWSQKYDNTYKPSEELADTIFFNVSDMYSGSQIVYARFVSTKDEVIPPPDQLDAKVPRVMFWWGKVNQHWDLDSGKWMTDPDGYNFGARENKLTYCQRFYPTTYKVVPFKTETINTWQDRGNVGAYTSSAMSYRCVLEGEDASGEDASNLPEKPNSGSICFYFPDLELCRPFSQTLKTGVVNDEVARLQKQLNARGYVVADSGKGSPGNETNYFGKATKLALMKFQSDNKITATGILGPKTRELLNSGK